jgi:uncharacterized protein YjiS (DUF1127 family)
MFAFAPFSFAAPFGSPSDRRVSVRDTVVRIALWPARVIAARQVMAQLAGMSEHELRDIGLAPTDIADASARALDQDPTPHLAMVRRARAKKAMS